MLSQACLLRTRQWTFFLFKKKKQINPRVIFEKMNNSDYVKTDGFPRGWSLANTCLRGGDVEMQWPEGCRWLSWPSAPTPVSPPHPHTSTTVCALWGQGPVLHLSRSRLAPGLSVCTSFLLCVECPWEGRGSPQHPQPPCRRRISVPTLSLRCCPHRKGTAP